MGEDLIPAPSAEGIELFLAELQQRMALLLTEIDGSDQAVDTSGVGCDAVRGQHPYHHSLHAFGVVLDLGAVLSEDSSGDVFRWCRAASAEQLHQHQGLIDVRHPHPTLDVVGESVVRTGLCRLHQQPQPFKV